MGTQCPSPITAHSPPRFSVHVCCGQTAGWIKMPLGTMEVLGLGNSVLDAGAAPPPKSSAPNFGLFCCGQTAGWINMPLGSEIGLGPGDIVLIGTQLPPPPNRATAAPPLFGPCLLWPNGCPSQQLLRSCNEARDDRVAMWRQLDHTQIICTSIQPAPNHSIFCRADALPVAQPTVSRH